MTYRANTTNSLERQQRRRGESARQQRKNRKLVRRGVKVAKLLQAWYGEGVILFPNHAGQFEAMMAPNNKARRQELNHLTPSGTRSSLGNRIGAEVPQDKQNNTHRFGGSLGYREIWRRLRGK